MKSSPVAYHPMYQIHEDGTVHSGKTDILLKPRMNDNGYYIVTLDQEQQVVHRLVALHFIPNPWGHPQVNHIDGDKSNNHVSNLEWVSAEQNSQHALATGLRKGFVHVDVRRALLARVLAGETILDVVSEVNNHPNTLSRMLREQAMKDGLIDEWTAEAKRKRKLTAVKNLEIFNARN